MESQALSNLVQGGAVGISIALIILIIIIVRINYKSQDRFMTHLDNHAQHQTDAMTKNTEATGELKGAVKELSIHVKSLNGKK